MRSREIRDALAVEQRVGEIKRAQSVVLRCQHIGERQRKSPRNTHHVELRLIKNQNWQAERRRRTITSLPSLLKLCLHSSRVTCNYDQYWKGRFQDAGLCLD